MRQLAGIVTMMLYVSLAYAATGGVVSGTITGPDGAPFRAAFVRAQNVQNKMTMMVLSDRQGKYRTGALPAGSYEVSATAVGYKSDPVRLTDVKVEDGKTVSINLAMQKSPIQWSQLTKYQAGMLLPDAKGKNVLLMQCFNCHGISKYGAMRLDRDGWLNAIGIMRRLGVANTRPEIADQVASYLATVFGPDSDTPQSPAQLTGYEKVKQEREYFTDDALNIEYVDFSLTGDPRDRPGTSKPDKDGNMWMEMSGGLSRLNPATGELKTWRLPDPSRPAIHEILPTPDGSVWLTVEAQNGLARFDARTETFDPVYKDVYDGANPPQKEPNVPWPGLRDDPGGQSGAPRSHTAVQDLEGNIWVSGRPLKKFDVKTKKFTNFPEVPDCYGIAVDKQGNVWFAELNARDHHSIGKVNVKTNQVTKYTPPNEDARPRRLKIDSQGMIWFGDYQGGYLTRFDPKAETFKLFKIPGPMPTPYGMGIDNNNNIWYASMYTDVIGRLDPKTGKFAEYPTPYGEKGTRDMFVDSEGRMWFGAQPYFKVGYVRLRTRNEVAQNR